jgi:hypothetical protein
MRDAPGLTPVQGRLAFWSVDRDQPCGGSVSGLPACSEISQQPLYFTKIFLKYTG